MRVAGVCAWCMLKIVLPEYVKGKVSWAKAHAYQNCGENTGHVFHDHCKVQYTTWLKTKPWLAK